MSYLPFDLQRPPAETSEERFSRRMATAALLRRRRLEAGLSYRQVALATMTDSGRISRYEHGDQFPGNEMAERILAAIDRLAAEGAGNPKRAAEAKTEYAAEEAEAAL